VGETARRYISENQKDPRVQKVVAAKAMATIGSPSDWRSALQATAAAMKIAVATEKRPT
jgi:hypothetical protein